MATLQKIRSKGPLLVIAVGLALFAFIAGDAWQVMQPHQSQDVGEVDGEDVSAQDYQALVEEYTEAAKIEYNVNSLPDEEISRIQDRAWQEYVNNKLIEKEAKKLGLTVSNEELQTIVNAGVHPLLQRLPFRNPQTGVFDKDMLNMFLVNYSKMNETQIPEDYQRLYNYWSYVEKQLLQSRLLEKYMALVGNALISNPVEAQGSYEARANQSDLLLAAIPYSTIADSTVTVSDADVKAAYEQKKEQYRQYVETRNIRYIDVQVTASDEDRAALQEEMQEYTTQLAGDVKDDATLVLSTGSDVSYVDLYYTKRGLPADVVARLDSVATGDVFGPYYNATDNTLNSFKKLAEASVADSVQYRQIQVIAESQARTESLADSIYNALKGGADFAELAKKYGQTGEPIWISSVLYEGAAIDNDNLKYIQAITGGKVNELKNLALGQGHIILQVTDKKAVTDKYKVAVVKRVVEFSKETYNKAYNNFSQFIATNNTLEKMVANAEDAGYRLLERNDLRSAEHGIGGIRDTKEALRWAFNAKPGEVSGLFECGDNDHMLMVGVSAVIPEGYRPLALVQNQLRFELIRDKKAEKIMADMQAAGASSFDQYKGMPNAVTDSLKMVTFAAPAYVPSLRSSEPLAGAYASVSELNQLSKPIKGNGGVFVLQPYAEDKLKEEYNEETEMQSLSSMHARLSTQLLNDLYLKADVKDMRYLFF